MRLQQLSWTLPSRTLGATIVGHELLGANRSGLMHRIRGAVRATFVVVLEQGLFEEPYSDFVLHDIAIFIIVFQCLLLLPSIETAPDRFLGRAARLLVVDTELFPLQVLSLSRFALLRGQRLLGVVGVEHVQDVAIVLSLGLLRLGMQVLLAAPRCSQSSCFRCFLRR